MSERGKQNQSVSEQFLHLLEEDKQAHEKVENAQNHRKEILEKAREDAERIIQEAQKEAEEQADEISRQAESEGEPETVQRESITISPEEIESFRRRAENNFDSAVERLLDWVTYDQEEG